MNTTTTCPDCGTGLRKRHNCDANRGSIHSFALSYLEMTAVDGQPTRWFWRGKWQIWSGCHYQTVEPEVIERDVFEFLVGKAAIKTSTIRAIVDLLRILQLCRADHSRTWLSVVGRPDPRHILSVTNGLLHLPDDGKPRLSPPSPAFFGLSATSYSFISGASCLKWCGFLDQIWGVDSEQSKILQEWFGYCLLPDTSQQKILAIIGSPRSGKSTIARVLTELLGRTNVASPSIRSLSGNFGLWGMLDKTLAIIPDATLPKPCPALEELLKSVSGEDAVDIHRKGLAPLTGIRLSTRLMLLANELPAFHDPSRALEQRLIVLETSKTYFGMEDTRLTNVLLEELPGILNWAIEGLKRLRVRGFFPDRPSTVDAESLLGSLPDKERVSRIVISYGRPCSRRKRSNRTY